jgi:hypothetical protein
VSSKKPLKMNSSDERETAAACNADLAPNSWPIVRCYAKFRESSINNLMWQKATNQMQTYEYTIHRILLFRINFVFFMLQNSIKFLFLTQC